MIPVRLGRRSAQLPTTWADCISHPTWLMLALELISVPRPLDELKLEFALRALRLPRWQWWRVAPSDGAQLAEQVAFLQEPPEPLATNPTLRLGRLHYTPRPWRDLRTWEYAKAEKYFRQVTNPEQPDALDGLIAVLFRPRRPLWWLRRGDPRQPFHDDDIPARLAQVARLPLAPKMAFWLHFLHFRSEVVSLHPHLHSGKGSAEADTASSWADTIISLSQPGQEDLTAQSLLAYTLRRLELKAKELASIKKPTTDENQ